MTRLIDTTSGDYDYTYLSLGAGVQSSALLVLGCTDERVPKPDVAIFADTGTSPHMCTATSRCWPSGRSRMGWML